MDVNIIIGISMASWGALLWDSKPANNPVPSPWDRAPTPPVNHCVDVQAVCMPWIFFHSSSFIYLHMMHVHVNVNSIGIACVRVFLKVYDFHVLSTMPKLTMFPIFETPFSREIQSLLFLCMHLAHPPCTGPSCLDLGCVPPLPFQH